MTARIEYTGDLRCSCTHLQSGSEFETDAPTDNRGKGERFSPTDTVCVALATCMITTMGIRAADMGIELKGTSLDVKKHMLSDPRRIGGVDIVLQMKTADSITDKDKEYLQRIGDNCPVMKSIHPDIIVKVQYIW